MLALSTIVELDQDLSPLLVILCLMPLPGAALLPFTLWYKCKSKFRHLIYSA